MPRTAFTSFTHRCAALVSDARGVSAVEFALIVPVMIALYVGAVEFSHGLTIERRVTTVASSVADLVAQSQEVSDSDLLDVFEAASALLRPYSTDPLRIIVTSVVADSKNRTKVDWSKANVGAAHAKGEKFDLPDGLTQPFSSVIVAEVSYTYRPPIGDHLTGGVEMEETFYLRPRRSLTVAKK